jgi:hypothetical protein
VRPPPPQDRLTVADETLTSTTISLRQPARAGWCRRRNPPSCRFTAADQYPAYELTVAKSEVEAGALYSIVSGGFGRNSIPPSASALAALNQSHTMRRERDVCFPPLRAFLPGRPIPRAGPPATSPGPAAEAFGEFLIEWIRTWNAQAGHSPAGKRRPNRKRRNP